MAFWKGDKDNRNTNKKQSTLQMNNFRNIIHIFHPSMKQKIIE